MVYHRFTKFFFSCTTYVDDISGPWQSHILEVLFIEWPYINLFNFFRFFFIFENAYYVPKSSEKNEAACLEQVRGWVQL